MATRRLLAAMGMLLLTAALSSPVVAADALFKGTLTRQTVFGPAPVPVANTYDSVDATATAFTLPSYHWKQSAYTFTLTYPGYPYVYARIGFGARQGSFQKSFFGNVF